jgi:hypothetical protein
VHDKINNRDEGLIERGEKGLHRLEKKSKG